jgi:tRNA (adenine22-N1)-methyltransferase
MYMNEFNLSKRLETVAKYIPKGSVLADIGSDHAYLPCYAVLNHIVVQAVAGEISDGPLRSAQQQVKKSGLEHKIDVRKGDGLEVIRPNEVDCITIAGMGGALISKILEEGKSKLDGVKRLVLQPNVGAKHIRLWLLDHQWEIVSEEILEEDNKIYEIIVAEKGDPKKPYENLEREILLGPFLIKEKNEAFRKKWSHELKNWKRIVEQLKKGSHSEENLLKQQELQRKIQVVEEVLHEQST